MNVLLIDCSQLTSRAQLGSAGRWQPKSSPYTEAQNWDDGREELIRVSCKCVHIFPAMLYPWALWLQSCGVRGYLLVRKAEAVRGSCALLRFFASLSNCLLMERTLGLGHAACMLICCWPSLSAAGQPRQ